MLNKIFKLKEKQTNVKTEIIAGITTFLSMAYILAVIPDMLGACGLHKPSLLVATALSAAIGSIIMGLLANYPIALGPGLGIAALFAFNIVKTVGDIPTSLAIVFLSGLIFLIISITGIRKVIINAIPPLLKTSISIGIGFFITFIGLKNAGLVVGDPNNLLAIGNLKNPSVLLALFGIILTVALTVKKVPASIFVAMLITMVVGVIAGFLGVEGMPHLPKNITYSFDLVYFGDFTKGMSKALTNISTTLPIIFSLLFVGFFDTAGTLLAVVQRAGLAKDKKAAKNNERALVADSIATMIASSLGMSNMTSFVESTSGVEVGGKSGLTAITTGILFILSLGLAPFIETLITPAVVAPALICVGILMASDLLLIKWDDLEEAAPSFLMIITMVLTFSISNGIAIGFLCYTVLKIINNQSKDIHYIVWILDAIFIMYFYFLA